MALSSTERRLEAKRKEQTGSIILVTGLLVCILSTVISPRALESLRALPDDLEPVEYLASVVQAFLQNFPELLAVRGPMFAIGLAQLLFSINVIWEANKMKNSMFKNR